MRFKKKKSNTFLIFVLGLLAALGPFSIDMYLPGFKVIAVGLNTTVNEVALTLSSYFIGISAGQLLYGPLLDKFGRKKPLYFGIALYLVASAACFMAVNINQLILFRFIQAVGSCAAAVAAIVLVRDLFEPHQRAKVFASLMLVIALSPMLAPTAGGYLIVAFGWQSVFVFLSIVAIITLALSYFFIPDVFVPDPAYSLKPIPIIKNFIEVIKQRQFTIYAGLGALVFSGLFVYVASSPIVFMELYGVSETGYGWIFAGLSVTFIGSSQLNSLLLRWYASRQIINYAIVLQVLASIVFLLFAFEGWLNLPNTLVFLSLYLIGLGFISPNAAALALAPFDKNAGSASALMGAAQMGLGALASVVVSSFPSSSVLPMPTIMTIATTFGAIMLFLFAKTPAKN